MSQTIRAVVVDDSPFVCRLITGYLQASGDIEVLAMLHDGRRAAARVRELRPDVVTLDLEMPDTNGLEALQHIMEETPTPVVVISGVSGRAATMTLQALERGAVDFVLKFTPGVDTDPEALRREIEAKVRLAARIQVVRSLRIREGTKTLSPAVPSERPEAPPPSSIPGCPPGVVVIGASTGGPLALRELLGHLPDDFSAAVIVVQHIPATFTGVLAAQLQRHTALRVREAGDGDLLSPGTVLVAPGGSHFLLRTDSRVELREGPAIAGHCPSIDVTMQTVAQVYGARTLGVILTGMGGDGARGLLAIHGKGGATLAQDEATSAIFGMPQRALEQGVVDRVGSPREIADMLAGTTFLSHHGLSHHGLSHHGVSNTAEPPRPEKHGLCSHGPS